MKRGQSCSRERDDLFLLVSVILQHTIGYHRFLRMIHQQIIQDGGSAPGLVAKGT